MQNSEFEKNVQQKMEELRLSPEDVLWDKIEAALPEKKQGRRVFIMLLFMLLLASLGIIILNKEGDENKAAVAAETVSGAKLNKDALNKNAAENSTGGVMPDDNSSDAVIDAATSYGNPQTPTEKNKQPVSIISGKSNYYKRKADYISDAADEITDGATKVSRYAAKTNMRIKAAAVDTTDTAFATEADVLTALPNSPLQIEIKQINPLQERLSKKTVLIPDINAATPAGKYQKANKKNDDKNHWRYGMLVAAGSSGIVNYSSRLSPFYNSNLSSTGGTAVQAQAGAANNPSSNYVLELGLWATKPVNDKWKFATGVNYTMQSNYLMVGNKVDSAVSVNFDVNKSIEASSYYQPGGNTKYVNQYHLLQVPVMVQYRPFKKIPLYTEAGVSTAVLFNSNALVYNYASKTYVTSPQLFNKVLMSVSTGVTADVRIKNVLPFAIGLNVRYGLNSVTNSSYSNQHFSNAMLYLKIPFKK